MHTEQRAQEPGKVRVQCLRGMSSYDEHKDWTIVEFIWVIIYVTVEVFQMLGFIKGLIIDFMNVKVWITRAFLSSTSHIAYNTPCTSFAVLTLSFRGFTGHSSFVMSETSVECTEADRLFEHLLIPTHYHRFCKCVLEYLNLCFSQWGQVTSFVWVIARISSKYLGEHTSV